jgi:hypothetical protein
MASIRGTITGLAIAANGAANGMAQAHAVTVTVAPDGVTAGQYGAQQSIVLPGETVANEQLTLGTRVEITVQRIG